MFLDKKEANSSVVQSEKLLMPTVNVERPEIKQVWGSNLYYKMTLYWFPLKKIMNNVTFLIEKIVLVNVFHLRCEDFLPVGFLPDIPVSLAE